MKKNKKKINNFSLVLILAVILCGGLPFATFSVFAEQSGSTPDSGTDSRIKATYDFLVTLTHGSESAGAWGDWGAYWNRIRSSAQWVPSTATATESQVLPSYTFYAGSDRTLKTGTAIVGKYDEQKDCRYDDWLASAGTVNENTSEESTWTLTADGGTAVSVTDNAITVNISSNKVYQDALTGLYWSDKAATALDNEFQWEIGDDPVTPTSTSCNFLSTGTANAYCDNRDPTDAITEDDDVSAAEFCLNLELDGDNADLDDDGTTGVETDWYLPTQKQLMQAYIDGSANNLPNAVNNFWSSSEYTNTRHYAWYVYLNYGSTSYYNKFTTYYVRCIRGTSE
ncbi:TPA: hypothetical protein DEP90_03150 [Patescibacteria group bacterium]|nr:hypothetical protein [Patescibacteria group bacterium]